MKNPLAIGHRGAMGYETENTLASIEKALELNAEGVEIDVFKCKSGEIVVFHDDDLERLSDGTGTIEDKTYEELQKLTLKGDHKIPLLKDILNLINGRCKVNIELKGNDTAIAVSRIINMYIEFDMFTKDDFIVSSFDENELEAFFKKNKNIAIGVLATEDPLQVLPFAKKIRAKSIHANFTSLTPNNVKLLKKNGYIVYAWTVNELKDIKKIKELKIHGIITDYPDRI